MQLLSIGNAPVTIRQAITAGNDFDGAAPGVTPGLSPGLVDYGENAHGGLFASAQDPAQSVRLVQIALRLDGNTTKWTVTLEHVDHASFSIPLFEGTNEDTYIKFGEPAYVVLTPGMYLKLVTAGATAMIEAWVTLEGTTDADGLI